MASEKKLKPIPIPLWRRWQDFRMQVLPLLVVSAGAAGFAWLWSEFVAPPVMLGEVEPRVALLASPADGMLQGMNVQTFEFVRAGQAIGEILTTRPELAERSLAVIAAEIENLQVSLDPVADHRREQYNHESLRLDWMKQRVTRETTQVNLQRAKVELDRTRELYTAGIISADELDLRQLDHEALKVELEQLDRVVADLSTQIARMEQPVDGAKGGTLDERLHAAIKVQEEQLALAETEMRPIPIVSPIDGTVSSIQRHAGEFMLAGEPIVVVISHEPDRIVGYLRQPLPFEPVVGAQVEVRSRDRRRASGTATILSVGTHMEIIRPSLLGALHVLNPGEMALPVLVSLPAGLRLRPGELVDLLLKPE